MKKSTNQAIYVVWIDRKHAMIMRTTEQGTTTYKEIKSSAGTRERFNGETTNKTGMLGTSIAWEKKKQEKENNHVQQFLKKVMAEFHQAKEILILGSGDTRYELQNGIEKSKAFNGVKISNRACRKITKRELEVEMEKEYHLHLG